MIDRVEPVAHRALGGALLLHVERRVDLEPAIVQIATGVLGLHQLSDVLDEVGGGDVVERHVLLDDRDRFVQSVAVLRGRDELVVEHLPEHVALAILGALEVHRRRIFGRRLGQAAQHRRLGDGQILGVLAEVDLGRRLHAVGAVAEIDVVGVDGEDLLLSEVLLDLVRQDGLADLAEDVALVTDEHQLGHLLRDGRAALDHVARLEVGEGGADDAERVDAVVLEEAIVLGGDERLHHVLRDLVVGQDDALLQVELADELALRREHAAGARWLVVGERAPAIGQVLLELLVTPVSEGGGERSADEKQEDEEADEREALAPAQLLFPSLQLACLVGTGHNDRVIAAGSRVKYLLVAGVVAALAPAARAADDTAAPAHARRLHRGAVREPLAGQGARLAGLGARRHRRREAGVAPGAAARLRRRHPRRARLRVRSGEGGAPRARRGRALGLRRRLCAPQLEGRGRRPPLHRRRAVERGAEPDLAARRRVVVGRRARAISSSCSTTTSSPSCTRTTGIPIPTRWRSSSGVQPRISTR